MDVHTTFYPSISFKIIIYLNVKMKTTVLKRMVEEKYF
jgi:hypothetical protein